MHRLRMGLVVVVCALGSLAISATGAVADEPGNSGAAHDCQQGGYLSLVGADGTTFSNAGDCISYAAQGGKFATGLVIPAGETATLSNATFGDFTPSNCPLDPLAYGYQLNMGADVQVADHPANAGCTHAAGATIGPFPTATLLRIWLEDLTTTPSYTFYSDSSHALVTGSDPYLVSIMDSYFGQYGPNDPRQPPGPGRGNINVTVTIS